MRQTQQPSSPRPPRYPDPEMADVTESERLAQYKQSAEYQARQERYRQWEAQQAYQRYRQGEWSDPRPQPKSWWQRVGEWFNQSKTGQRIRNATVGFLSGLAAGAVTGAVGGAIVGSLAGGVGAGPGALGGAIIGGITGSISGLVTGLVSQPSTPPGRVAVNAAIWGGITGLLAGVGSVAAGIQGFAHGGQAWHIGLETASHLNIVHIGVHTEYGFHIAFGAVRPYAANLHIYLQRVFPFFRIWHP